MRKNQQLAVCERDIPELREIDAMRLQSTLVRTLAHYGEDTFEATEAQLFESFEVGANTGNVSEATVAYWRLLNLYGHHQIELLHTDDDADVASSRALSQFSTSMALAVRELTDPRYDFFETIENFKRAHEVAGMHIPKLAELHYFEEKKHRDRVREISKEHVDDAVEHVLVASEIQGLDGIIIIGLGASSLLPSKMVYEHMQELGLIDVRWQPVTEFNKGHSQDMAETLYGKLPDNKHAAIITAYDDDLERVQLIPGTRASIHLL